MPEKYDLEQILREIPEDEISEQEGRLKQLTHDDIQRMVEVSLKTRQEKAKNGPR